jgi:signal transduction histidine kinase
LEIRVENDGPGISDATAERIFEPYFSRRRKGPRGSGLGLAFRRLAADSLGGSIAFRPRAPPGAAFIIDLPGN